jgi:hypothetical protein
VSRAAARRPGQYPWSWGRRSSFGSCATSWLWRRSCTSGGRRSGCTCRNRRCRGRFASWSALSQELGPKGIRINSVSPGPVATDLWLGDHGVAATIGAATGVDAARVREQAIAGMPTGRFTTPEEVATLVALLASPRTGNVTGSNYVIDGGLIKTL